MNRVRMAVSLSAALTALGLSVLGLSAADEKKAKKRDTPQIVGTLESLEADYKVTNDAGKVVLEGTKVTVRIAKAKGSKIRDPFVVMNRQTKVSFETDDKELKARQYVKIWFDDGAEDPDRQGLATRIVVGEDPKAAKAKKKKKAE